MQSFMKIGQMVQKQMLQGDFVVREKIKVKNELNPSVHNKNVNNKNWGTMATVLSPAVLLSSG